MELLEVTKKYNFFEFGSQSFKQVGGTSIGKKHAPPLACLAAGKFEEEQIFTTEIFKDKILNDIYSDDEKDRFFKRFIDDMIGAFIGNEEEAQNFVNWMNTLWPGLKFTFDWSNKEITYLDVKLIMTEDGGLETDRYVKPTNPQLFLHYESNHPRQVFKAIVYGQAITVKMICSQDVYVDKHFESLKKKFEERGYPVKLIEDNLNRGGAMLRADILKPKPPYPCNAVPAVPTKQKFKPTFIITYNPHNPELRSWLQETFFILEADKKMCKIYTQPPSVVYRQSRSLKSHLVKTSFKELPYNDGSDLEQRPPGCYKHQHGARGGGGRCKLCQTLKESTHFSSSFTGLKYKIRHHLTCKSKNTVYLITCQGCSKQYTGSSTDPLHVRHGGHRQEIRSESTELGRHFARCGVDNLSIQAIDCVKHGQADALRYLEGIWQNRLATFEQNGNINIRNEMRRNNGRVPDFVRDIFD